MDRGFRGWTEGRMAWTDRSVEGRAWGGVWAGLVGSRGNLMFVGPACSMALGKVLSVAEVGFLN